jgi:hypothetical protein
MNNIYHTTPVELDFIEGLGKWSEHRVSRMDLLRGYLRSMQLRTDWSGMSRHDVERRVLMLIEREVVLAGVA